MRTFSLALGFVALLFPALAWADPPKKEEPLPETVSYFRDIRPVFQANCQGCHQPAKPLGGLVMSDFSGMFKAGESGNVSVTPGNPAKSELLAQIMPKGKEKPNMPKERDPLTARQVALVTKWIEQGAKDDSPASTAPKIDLEHPPVYKLAPLITGIDYSPNGKVLAVSAYHEVILLDAADPKPEAALARLVGLSERIESVRFSPDGKQLCVAGGSPGRFGEIQIWDVEQAGNAGYKPKLASSVMTTFDTVYGATWSHDGTRIAYGCADNTVRAIDAKTGKQVLYQGAHADWVLATVWSKDSSHLVSVSRDRSMKLTEVATQRFVDNITSITPGALKGGLMCVDRHPMNDELLIGGSDGAPKLYKMFRTQARQIGDDFNLIRPFEALPGRVFACRFNKDGSLIAAASSFETKGEARIYQTADAKLVAKLEGQSGGVFAVAFSPDGNQVATGGFDGKVRINNPRDGKLIKEFVAVPLTPSVAAK